MSMAGMSAPKSGLRAAAGKFATGITVVSTGTARAPHGITVNAFTSVSLDPPLVLICVGHDRRSHDLIQREGRFGVSVLARDQQAASEFYAGQRADLPPGAAVWREGRSGVPLLEGALAHLECRVVAAYPAGDHTLFVAAVEHCETMSSGAPLLYFEGRYTTPHWPDPASEPSS